MASYNSVAEMIADIEGGEAGKWAEYAFQIIGQRDKLINYIYTEKGIASKRYIAKLLDMEVDDVADIVGEGVGLEKVKWCNPHEELEEGGEPKP